MTTLTEDSAPKSPSEILSGSTPKPMNLVCQLHGEYAGHIWQIAGLSRQISSSCPKCQALKDQKQLEQQQQKLLCATQAKISQLAIQSGIPKRFAGRTFENYQAKTPEQQQVLKISRHYAEQFDERFDSGGSLIFAGKPGAGKTHLAVAIANQLIKKGYSVLYLTVMRALRLVKDCYRRDAVRTEQQVLDGFLKPDLLILDEVGVQFGSETEKLILFEILNGRYERVLPNILISNLSDPELIQYIGARCYDRLHEGGGVSLSFNWDSYRQQVNLDKNLPTKTKETKPVDWT